MSLRAGGRKVSFEILSGDDGDQIHHRKRRAKSAKRKSAAAAATVLAAVVGNGSIEAGCNSASECKWAIDSPGSEASCVTFASSPERGQQNANDVPAPPGENGLADVEDGQESTSPAAMSIPLRVLPSRLETEKSMDWERVIAEHSLHPRELSSWERTPLKHFIGELYGGSSLRSTISVGNEKKRQGVYNTMFHVPWRCERLIIAGFFVCLDSFFSLLTIMPARILLAIWRLLKTRKLLKPSAADLSDFGCFIVLFAGVASLRMIDISFIYHVIRGQGAVKLYVVYNVLEILDKLCQSFGEDVLQVLFNSAEALSDSLPDHATKKLTEFMLDEFIAVVAFVFHSFVLLAEGITLSACLISHNNALVALLVSNNFAEVKSNLFKRVSKDNLQSLVYYDVVERFHITVFLLFVLAQNLLEAEGQWVESFLNHALLVYLVETLIDTVKHSFLAKFNEIEPAAYSEFLRQLCRQVTGGLIVFAVLHNDFFFIVMILVFSLQIQPFISQVLNDKADERQRDLSFIPLAPACVVIHVLTPVYATLLPNSPVLWRFFWIFVWSSLTYSMLAICKILVGLVLRCLSTWYVNQNRPSTDPTKEHTD